MKFKYYRITGGTACKFYRARGEQVEFFSQQDDAPAWVRSFFRGESDIANCCKLGFIMQTNIRALPFAARWTTTRRANQ